MGVKAIFFVEYNGRKVTMSQLSELTGIDVCVLRTRYVRGDRGDALVRPIIRENTTEAVMSKKTFVHELWHGKWCYKGKRIYTDDELREIRRRRL